MKIGDKLYARHSALEYTVTKVGKKYFEVDRSCDKFLLDSLSSHNAFRTMHLCADKQLVLDELERDRLLNGIRRFFSGWDNKPSLTLEQLRSIWRIIKPDPLNVPE